MNPTFKQKVGCWLNERWKAELVLQAPALAKMFGWSWLDLCNRNERLSKDEQSGGRICHWKDSSQLTVARFFPSVGGRILERVIQEFPFRLATQKEIESKKPPQNPEVSVVMVVRGTGRLPQFQAALASLIAQEGCETEIVVVEQSETKEFEALIPHCVKYIHTPTKLPFNRSWGLNVGVQNASGQSIIIYDADMVAPVTMAASVCKQLGCQNENNNTKMDAIRLSRFMFFLDQPTSKFVQENRTVEGISHLTEVVQNVPNPFACKREVYLQLGGHDESFYRWGGEDNEFMSRLRTKNLAEGSYLPIFHLWHEAAENKTGDRNTQHLETRMNIPAEKRIEELSQLPFGQMTPTTLWKEKQNNNH